MKKQQLQLLLIAGLFALPVLASTLLFMTGWQPGGKQHGTLIEPPVDEAKVVNSQLGAVELTEIWSMVYRMPEPCLEACRARIEKLVNVRIALGREAPRTQVVLIGAADDDLGLPQLAPSAFGSTTMPDGLIVIDPAARAFLRFDAGFEMRDLLQDMRHLLKWQKLDR